MALITSDCTRYTLLGHTLPIFNAVFDKSGTRLVTGSDDKVVTAYSCNPHGESMLAAVSERHRHRW